MGGLMSYLFAGRVGTEHVNDPNLDIPDPKTNLTPRQKGVIRETWSLVQKDLRTNGVDLFLAFFKAYPSYQNHFKSFADVPYDQLKDNKKVQAHALNVMYAITSLVENLDDTECLKEMLLKTGENHRRHSITTEQFEHLAVIVVDLLAAKLGEMFTPFTRAAWIQVLEIISAIVEQTLEPKTPS